MTWWHALDRQLRSEQTGQLLALFLLFSVLALLFSWSGSAFVANDSWYTVTALRRGALALMAVWLGLSTFRESRRTQLLTAAVLCLLSLLGAPFSIAAWAASYPATDPAAGVLLDTVFGAGLYAFTAFSARLFGRVFWLALPAAALLLTVTVFADDLAGRNLAFPFRIQEGGLPLPVITWAVLALGFLAVLPAGSGEEEP